MSRRLFMLVLASLCPAGAEAQTRLLRQPTVSASQVAFAYANNIWIAGREGGEARRLTSFQGVTSDPQFSPDGRSVAFSGQYGGNTDVYVVSAAGGEPKRLTWHPGADIVQGWTPAGARIVFASGRTSAPSGTMIAPRGGFFDREGKWAVENEGITPDIDVENWPKDVIAGRDPQLERAVAEGMRLLRANPPKVLAKEPDPPVRNRRPATFKP